jgi:hypothetical protein
MVQKEETYRSKKNVCNLSEVILTEYEITQNLLRIIFRENIRTCL